VKANSVVGEIELIREVIDGPRPLTQKREQSTARAIGCSGWSPIIRHLPEF
jgi:hypothetical protein